MHLSKWKWQDVEWFLIERGLYDFIASAKRQGLISGSDLLRLTAEQAVEWQTSEGERPHKNNATRLMEVIKNLAGIFVFVCMCCYIILFSILLTYILHDNSLTTMFFSAVPLMASERAACQEIVMVSVTVWLRI